VVAGLLGAGTALDHVLVVFIAVGLGLVLDLFLFLDRGAGDLLADLAFGAFAAFFGLVELLGGRALRQHGFEIDDLAQLHAAFVERIDFVLDDAVRLLVVVTIVVTSVLVLLDDLHAHVVERGHDVLDLLVLVGRDRGVDLVDGDDAALLGARDQLLHRRIVH